MTNRLKNLFLQSKKGWSDYGISKVNTTGARIITIDSENPLHDTIEETIPSLLDSFTNDKFLFSQGSCGDGNRTQAPWIATFHSDMTQSAQSGYYVVYLYSCDLKKLYLTMGLGSYQFAKIYGENNFALSKMQEAASKLIECSNLLKTKYLDLSGNNRITEGPINLHPYKKGYSNHKAYGSSSIYSISYDLNDLPEDEFLVEDYLDFINFYKKLVYDPAIPSVEELLLSNDETNISEATLEVIDFIPRKPPKKRAKSQGSDSKSSNQQRRSKDAFVTGKIGEEIVFNYEKEQLGNRNSDYEVIWCRNDPKDRTPGYDILSFDKDGNKKYIEVKSEKGSKISSVSLTAHEWEVAQDEKYKDNYYLYLVTNVLSNNVKIEVIKNPARMTSENKFHIVVSDYQLFFHTDL